MSTRKRQSKIKDPQAQREAQKYEFPVPSREAVLLCLEKAGQPLDFQELCSTLDVTDERDQDSFKRRLRAMERDGQILRNRRKRYGLIDRLDLLPGTVIGHPDGYGFLRTDAEGDDLYLSAREMRKVLHGDRVLARVTGVDRRGRKEGSIVEVVERANDSVVGRYFEENNIGFVRAQDSRISQDIMIPAGEEGGARSGQIVVTTITQQPTSRLNPVGRIAQVLGDHMAPGMETDVIIRMHNLPHEWREDVLAESEAIGSEVDDKDKQGRVDLRQLPLITIDGEDAKDFDDAIHCQREGKGFRLRVAIADVSHYVKPGSALDTEAYNRGTSVYFPNRVIPMLPESLSNGLCSLKPDVDRLCMVCDMQIGARGKINRYEFYPAVMRSHARMTYTKVAAILVDRDPQLTRQYQDQLDNLENLYQLFKVLHELRLQRGAVDFDLPETKILFNDNGKIDRVVASERNDAHRLIEECMLAANVCAAEFLAKNNIPTPYRTHAGPEAEKLAALREFLSEFGLKLRGGNDPHASDYAATLEQVSGKPVERLVQTVMLRSLSQAIYSTEEIGHFALAYERYAHFTSPIRRYPDLMVHRAIKAVVTRNKNRSLASRMVGGRGNKGLAGKVVGEVIGYKPDNALEEIEKRSLHCSTTGRRADEASWDVVKWLKTEFMLDKIGEEYEGLVTGVTNFGLFIELKEIFVEGLVHVTSLGNDYYHFDPERHLLLGERTNQSFRLTDEVRVRVARVDLDEARIDFELLEKLGSHYEEFTAPRPRKKKQAKKKKAAKRKTGKQAGRKKGGKPAQGKSGSKRGGSNKPAKKARKKTGKSGKKRSKRRNR
jgi:ribonuclease R